MSDGTIAALWRYPVKSLLGEKLGRMEFDQRGVVNDRIYAIMNRHGKFGSGKTTRRFIIMDGLFSMSAACTHKGVDITFPDGSVLGDESSDIHAKLSRVLEQKVELTREQTVPHFDAGAVHIISLSALAKLQETLPNLVVDPRRFRANIVIDASRPITDADLVGKMITIGELKLKLVQKTERCRMITLAQGELGAQAEILKAVYQNNALKFGVYASVIHAGTIKLKDAFTIE